MRRETGKGTAAATRRPGFATNGVRSAGASALSGRGWPT